VSGAVRLAAVHWPADAEKLGFSSNGRGKRARNGSVLRSEGNWLALAVREPYSRNPPLDLMGCPGLWRGLREQPELATTRWTRVFELPPVVTPEALVGACAEHPCAALVRWAEATRDGSVPSSWAPPTREDVEDWTPPARRSVRAGGHVAQIEVLVEPARFALVIPALARIPAELVPARAAWLAEICRDTQERWRMVRFGIDEAASSVRAEVDLTGAPSDRAQPLAELALAALTCAAEWALPALSLVTDPSLASRMIDEEPGWAPSRPTTGGKKG
jgi:hypothetical protein